MVIRREEIDYSEQKIIAGIPCIPIHALVPPHELFHHEKYFIEIQLPTIEQQNAWFTSNNQTKVIQEVDTLVQTIKATLNSVYALCYDADSTLITKPYQGIKRQKGLGLVIKGYVYGYTNEEVRDYHYNTQDKKDKLLYIPINSTSKYITNLNQLNQNTILQHTAFVTPRNIEGYHINKDFFNPFVHKLLLQELKKA